MADKICHPFFVMDELSENLVDLAIELQANGKFDEAEKAIKRAIELDPSSADAHHSLGAVLQATGRYEQAVPSHLEAIRLDGEVADYFTFLASALLKTGRIEPALAAQEQAIKLDPSPENWSRLAAANATLGRLSEGTEIYQHVLLLRPDDPAILNDIGVCLRLAGRASEAIPYLERSRSASPERLETRHHLVKAYHEAGLPADAVEDARVLVRLSNRATEPISLLLISLSNAKQFDEMLTIAREAVREHPEELEFHFQLAIAFQFLGDFAPAIIALRRCLEIDNQNINVLNRLGYVLFLIGQPMAAKEVLTQTSTLQHANFETWMALAVANIALSAWNDSVEAAKMAVKLSPHSAAAILQLVLALIKAGKHDDAEKLLDESESNGLTHPHFHMQRGTICSERGLAKEAIKHFERATMLDSEIAKAGGLAAMFHNYLDDATPEYVFEQHRQWANQHEAVVRESAKSQSQFKNTRDPDRKLRVGFMSPDFRGHSVSFFFIPILRALNREKYTAVCFDNTRTLDLTSKSLHEIGNEWHRVVGLSDKVVADIVAKQNIDILVDLAGHTADSRLSAMAYRPAPVQISYLGYPNTTGLETVDYRIVDSFTDPVGVHDDLYVEKRLRLDPIFLTFDPFKTPKRMAPPHLGNGFVTFGSFNNFLKVSDTTLQMWCDVLSRIPHSKMLLKASGLSSSTTQKRVGQRFESMGIHSERLIFVDRIPTHDGHLGCYGRVDIALDTFPYSGTTTTCEALWMGVPVISLVGDVHAARVTGSILNVIGQSDLTARTRSEYIETAVGLALNPDRLNNLRFSLREKMKLSPLMDHESFVRRFERLLRSTWQDWCNSLTR